MQGKMYAVFYGISFSEWEFIKVLEEHEANNVKEEKGSEMLDEIDLRAGIVMELLRLITQLIEDSNKQMGELAIEINCDYIKLEQLGIK